MRSLPVPITRSIVEIACLAITSFDEALQVYVPESSFFVFQIWSVQSALTFHLPKGSDPFSFTQVIVGWGSPVAWQGTVIFRCWFTSSLADGLTVNCSSSTTIRWVTADSCPKIFIALHLYKPESLFCAFIIDRCRSFEIALACAISPCTLDHVITGGGEPVTWHFGKLIFLSFSAYDGPRVRDIFGLPPS